jgi:hypothetical protein
MITKQQVLDAQSEWGEGVVKIGSLKEDRIICETYANEFLTKLYAYAAGSPVIFKPTKCEIEQFRPTQPEALSYFIAGENRTCKEDKGFAIQSWTKVRFENAGMILEKNHAIAMGNYFFTDLNGDEAKVEFTFGYKLIGNEMKIDVHHSSFPYKYTVA